MKLLPVLLLLLSLPLHAGQGLSAIPGKAMAPDFELVDTEGQTHRLSDYRGRTVIINFWTTWCPPCREEIPSMNRAGILALLLLAPFATAEDKFVENYKLFFKEEISGRWQAEEVPALRVVMVRNFSKHDVPDAARWLMREVLVKEPAARPSVESGLLPNHRARSFRRG